MQLYGRNGTLLTVPYMDIGPGAGPRVARRSASTSLSAPCGSTIIVRAGRYRRTGYCGRKTPEPKETNRLMWPPKSLTCPPPYPNEGGR